MRRFVLLLALMAPALPAGDIYVRRASMKLGLIEDGKAPPGSVVVFTLEEVNSWAKYRVPGIVPDGIRNQRVELGTNMGTAYALMDFLKMSHAKGASTNWLISKLIEGERPVKIAIRVESGGGKCVVYLTRVEISGVAATGAVLDTLVKTFFMPLYPDAHINEKFDLCCNIDRIDIRPTRVRVTMKREFTAKP